MYVPTVPAGGEAPVGDRNRPRRVVRRGAFGEPGQASPTSARTSSRDAATSFEAVFAETGSDVGMTIASSNSVDTLGSASGTRTVSLEIFGPPGIRAVVAHRTRKLRTARVAAAFGSCTGGCSSTSRLANGKATSVCCKQHAEIHSVVCSYTVSPLGRGHSAFRPILREQLSPWLAVRFS